MLCSSRQFKVFYRLDHSFCRQRAQAFGDTMYSLISRKRGLWFKLLKRNGELIRKKLAEIAALYERLEKLFHRKSDMYTAYQYIKLSRNKKVHFQHIKLGSLFLNKTLQSILNKQLRLIFSEIKEEGGAGLMLGMSGLKLMSVRMASRSNLDAVSKLDQSEIHDIMDEDAGRLTFRTRKDVAVEEQGESTPKNKPAPRTSKFRANDNSGTPRRATLLPDMTQKIIHATDFLKQASAINKTTDARTNISARDVNKNSEAAKAVSKKTVDTEAKKKPSVPKSNPAPKAGSQSKDSPSPRSRQPTASVSKTATKK